MITRLRYEKIPIDIFLDTLNINLNIKTTCDITIDETFDREIFVDFYSEPHIFLNGIQKKSSEDIKMFEEFVASIIFYQDKKWNEIKGNLTKISDFSEEQEFIDEFPKIFSNIKTK